MNQLHYDRSSHGFWTETDGIWTPVNKDLARLLLEQNGYSAKPGTSRELEKALARTDEDAAEAVKKAPKFSRVDEIICNVVKNHHIDFACNVAGWDKGVHDMFGKKVLVREAPMLWTPAEGDWSFYDAILKSAGRVYKIQEHVLKSWLLLGMDKIYHKIDRFSQVCLNVGNAGSGKSLFQQLVTCLCGNSEADPIEWILGHTNFAKELMEALHLCVAEPSAFTFKEIQLTWNRMKEISVKFARRCRGLYSEAVTVAPRQICSFTLNPEGKNADLIPQPIAGIEDKFHGVLFPSNSFPLPGFPLMTVAENQALLAKQAPAFLWHLFNEYKIPPELRTRVDHPPYDCHRFGMDPYHNPELMEMVTARSDEVKFITVFERVAHMRQVKMFYGTASKLSEWVLERTDSPDAKRLCRDAHKLGILLSSLHRQFPEKVQPDDKVKTKKFGKFWTILVEPHEEAEEQAN